jgi:acetyl-CoA acyltransferase
MHDAVIIDAIRTPGGKRNGKLSSWHPAALAAHVLKGIELRNSLDPMLIDDVIMGCVIQVGEQALNIGRNSVLTAGWPEEVPATTVDRQCGSSQQAMHFAAQGVMAGVYDVVIAAGVEVMSRTPMDASTPSNMGSPLSQDQISRYAATGLPPQGIGAELVADEFGLSRDDLDSFGAQSQQRAVAATREGRFENEILPVPLADDVLHVVDEGIREDTTTEGLAKLKPAFKDGGKVTAGNSSQICDGASAVLIMSAQKADALKLQARARFHSFAVAGTDPVTMLKGPIPATQKILHRTGMDISDVDVFEINEAFASVVLAWQQSTGADMSRVNRNGGAIALGHPLGSSGTKLMATLLNELERTNGRFGMQVMCEGGGLANATIIENLTGESRD